MGMQEGNELYFASYNEVLTYVQELDAHLKKAEAEQDHGAINWLQAELIYARKRAAQMPYLGYV